MIDQESQLKLAMGTAATQLLTTVVERVVIQQNSVGESSYTQELTPKDVHNGNEGGSQVGCHKGDISNGEWNMQGGSDLWKTPEQERIVNSDCHIVGNKFYSLIEDDSNHSKWDEFRKLAKRDSATEECFVLLKRVELEGSEDEDDLLDEEDMFSLEDAGILPSQIDELEDLAIDKGKTKKNQKRKTGWGPILRAPRPRRVPEDGRTVLEKAQDLKKVRNLEKGTYPKPLFLLRVMMSYLIGQSVLIFLWVLIR